MSETKSSRVAVLATDGFEQAELFEPVRALREAGITVAVVAPRGGEIQGMKHRETGERAKVDLELGAARAETFDALVLPGGVANPDELRTIPAAVDFVKHFVTAKKPIAAICHGPWTLVEADALRGRTVTSWPSLHTDLENAGASWVDREVVVDGNLVTSRKPDDLPAFNQAFLTLLNGRGTAAPRSA